MIKKILEWKYIFWSGFKVLICKIFGIISLIFSFFYGFKKWIREKKKENLVGLIVSYIVIIGAMFGIIYLVNN